MPPSEHRNRCCLGVVADEDRNQHYSLNTQPDFLQLTHCDAQLPGLRLFRAWNGHLRTPTRSCLISIRCARASFSKTQQEGHATTVKECPVVMLMSDIVFLSPLSADAPCPPGGCPRFEFPTIYMVSTEGPVILPQSIFRQGRTVQATLHPIHSKSWLFSCFFVSFQAFTSLAALCYIYLWPSTLCPLYDASLWTPSSALHWLGIAGYAP